LCAGDIEGFDPQVLLWSTYETIADCVDATHPAVAAAAAAGGPDAMQVDAGSTTSGTASAAQSGGTSEVQQYLLQQLCGVLCVSPKEEVRCAGVVVLVSLLQLCSGSGVLREALPRLQSTFTGLLGDSNDLTQVRGAGGRCCVLFCCGLFWQGKRLRVTRILWRRFWRRFRRKL
jgi:hypothetical protein